MSHFIRRFKKLPWLSLLQSVALTYLIIAIAEIFTLWGITHSPAFKQIMLLLLTPPLGMLIIFGMGVGAGLFQSQVKKSKERAIAT